MGEGKRGMEMPREHGGETYESEAALRALRGISQVAMSPIASTGFRSGCSAAATASKNHDGSRRVYGGGVVVCSDAAILSLSLFLFLCLFLRLSFSRFLSQLLDNLRVRSYRCHSIWKSMGLFSPFIFVSPDFFLFSA